MNNKIAQLTRECDLLAARYYKLDSGSRERAARDWLQKVKETANFIKPHFQPQNHKMGVKTTNRYTTRGSK